MIVLGFDCCTWRAASLTSGDNSNRRQSFSEGGISNFSGHRRDGALGALVHERANIGGNLVKQAHQDCPSSVAMSFPSWDMR